MMKYQSSIFCFVLFSNMLQWLSLVVFIITACDVAFSYSIRGSSMSFCIITESFLLRKSTA